MKVAVTYENGKVFGHFGHTESFKIYLIENEEVKASEIVAAGGSGHGALAGFLKEKGVDTLICGGIGMGARIALAEEGIRIFPGVDGDADEAVKCLLCGNLDFDPDAQCNHHHEGEQSCGEHECGGHCGEDKKGCSGNH